MNFNEYKKDMKIDENALDLEWLNHADLEAKYIEKVSEARKERDWAWEEVKTTRSELIREANGDPEGSCDKKKPNAADIEAFYRTHVKYITTKSDLIEAEDTLKVLEDMKDAIHFTRTKALEGLVRLLGEEYFAGPRIPRNIQNERNQRDKTTKSIGKSMKRKKEQKGQKK